MNIEFYLTCVLQLICVLCFLGQDSKMTVSSLAAQLSENRKKLREEERAASTAESTPVGKNLISL